jgi:hypothetical protein
MSDQIDIRELKAVFEEVTIVLDAMNAGIEAIRDEDAVHPRQLLVLDWLIDQATQALGKLKAAIKEG